MSEEKWIGEAVERHGRVRKYLRRKYGDKAFDSKGNIKCEYIKRALKDTDDKSLRSALHLAGRLKKCPGFKGGIKR